MNKIDHAVAMVDAYSRSNDLLMIEELILAAMGPREPETRTAVMAQAARVNALRTVRDQFAKHLDPTPETGRGG